MHNQVRIKPGDEKGVENLSQYIIRNTFSLEKLKYEERTASVIENLLAMRCIFLVDYPWSSCWAS